MKRILLCGVVALVIAGCASETPKDQTPVPVVEGTPAVTPPPVTPPPATQAGPDLRPVKPPPVIIKNPLTDPGSILSKRSVFFDYDSNAVKDEFKPLITAHGNYLRANRGAKIMIEGNTDERGSREYNIALGQRRADSIKQMLLLLGAQESQIESVSFGEEKPRATGKDESSYSQNRRGDIRYQGE